MTAQSLNSSATEVLESWKATDPQSDSVRHTMLAFLGSAPRGCLREHVAGHVTASSLVLDATGEHALLTLHPRVGRWIQLGGHCEETDSSIVAAALREAVEESGIADLEIDPELLAVHTHPITCSLGVPTRHLDLRFLVRAPAGAKIVRSDESDDLRWWPVDALPPSAQHDTIGDLVRAARQRVSAQGISG